MAISERAASPCTVVLPLPQSVVNKRVGKRRVRIDECHNQIFPVECLSDDATQPAWYTAEELRQFRRQHRELCQNLQLREAAMRARCPRSYGNVMGRLYAACLYRASRRDTTRPLLSDADRQVLWRRVSQSHGRLGLDAVHELCVERSRLRLLHLEAVAAGQTQQCRALSLPSRLLARYMATVLEASLRQPDAERTKTLFKDWD